MFLRWTLTLLSIQRLPECLVLQHCCFGAKVEDYSEWLLARVGDHSVGDYSLCHHQARSFAQRRWRTCHTFSLLNPLYGAWWWHFLEQKHGGGPSGWGWSATLTLVNVYVPWCRPAPGTTHLIFDALLKDRGDQMVLSDLNAHHPSWFSKTEEYWAAAWYEDLDEAVANLSLSTRLPSRRDVVHPHHPWIRPHPYNHLPFQLPRKVRSYTTERDSHQSQRGDLLRHHYQPPALLEKKSSGVFSATQEDTISSVVMSGTKASFSLRDQRCIDVTLDPAIQRHLLQWTQDQWRLLLDSLQEAIARAFNRQFTTSSVSQDRTLRRLIRVVHSHHPVIPSYRWFDERGVAAAIRKAGSSTS